MGSLWGKVLQKMGLGYICGLQVSENVKFGKISFPYNSNNRSIKAMNWVKLSAYLYSYSISMGI